MKVNKRVLRSDNIMRTFFAASVVSFATTMVALGWVVANPLQYSTADATEASTPAQSSKVSVNVYDLISLSLNDEINVDITPEDVAYSNLKTSSLTPISVSTNVPNGYILYIADLDNDTNLVNTDSASHKIAALPNIVDNSAKTWAVSGDTVTDTDFANNSWGYSTDYAAATNTGTFRGVEYARSMLKYTEGPATNDTTELTIGARVDTHVAAGTYQDVIVISAVPNSTVTSRWDDLIYMQDMNNATCVSAPESSSKFSATKSLIDRRDGKSYMVSRLADGHCWMTQNLALDLTKPEFETTIVDEVETQTRVEGTGTVLTADDTDLHTQSEWWPEYTTQITTGTSWASNGSDGAHSYSNGTLYYGPGADKSKGGVKYANLSACMTAGYDSETCQHYKVGNFYNWTAATLGSGKALTSNGQVAQDSICPKGWQLPVNGGNTVDRSWANITNFYIKGLATGDGEATFTVTQAPLYLSRAGYYNYNGNLNYQGSVLNYWSATAYSSTGAYYLGAYGTGFYPSNYDDRGYGFSVRCVSRLR